MEIKFSNFTLNLSPMKSTIHRMKSVRRNVSNVIASRDFQLANFSCASVQRANLRAQTSVYLQNGFLTVHYFINLYRDETIPLLVGPPLGFGP